MLSPDRRHFSILVSALLIFVANVHASTQHTVRRGESLWTLSRQYRVSEEALRTTNGIQGDRIKVGRVLLIPDQDGVAGNNSGKSPLVPPSQPEASNPSLSPFVKGGSSPGNAVAAEKPSLTHRVGRGETLSHIARRYRVKIEDIRIENGLTGDQIQVGQRSRSRHHLQVGGRRTRSPGPLPSMDFPISITRSGEVRI